ncbi:hypothetical protein Y032_0002g775 [Ancylostoma ceylanicum]|uniref:Uncharacterized protein n=1 Tax=Ancylostoma ceylanicum TaxID=53326 RepID=A0A016W321_9BILA|nr:hypothetical protein Y032_0002g775 [Ancylostoma ceylanicum]
MINILLFIEQSLHGEHSLKTLLRQYSDVEWQYIWRGLFATSQTSLPTSHANGPRQIYCQTRSPVKCIAKREVP